MEDQVLDESMDYGRYSMSIKFWVAVVVVLASILVYVLKKKLTRCNTVLIVGLSDSGKTVMFSKLVNPKYTPETYTSLKENRCEDVSVASDKLVTVVDFPGCEKLRKQLFENYLQKNRNSLKGIVFVIDSSTFSKRSRDVAAFLYDVLYESEKMIPILVACNKQNCSLAKSSQAVRTALEREFGYINGTSEAALDCIDGPTRKKTLTSTGKSFRWDDLSSPRLDFIECFVKEENEDDGGKHCDISGLLSWIASL